MIDPIIKSLVIKKETLDTGKMELEVLLSIPKDSVAFKGHFDQLAVLAGAYQIYLCKYWSSKLLNSELFTEEIRKSRLSGLIYPNEEFNIKVKVIPYEESDSLFKISAGIFKNKKRVMNSTLICRAVKP